jgi:hypothetical protein
MHCRFQFALFVLVAASLAACSKSSPSTASLAAPSPLAQDAKPGTPPVVSLTVTVSNTDSFGNAAGITNDGAGAYVDGSQNVQAQLDASGTFAFNTFNARRGTATRWLNYDFSHPIDPSNTFVPSQDHGQNYHFSSGGTQYSPWVPVQYLGTPGYPISECGYMGNSFAANSTTNYRVSFHKGYENTQASPTAFIVVTRTSVSPAVWTVQPAGSCSPKSNVAALRSDDGTVLYGYYSLPFLFTLTAK